jgi:hypothetical protein
VLYLFWFGESPYQTLIVNAFLYVPFALLCALWMWRSRARLGKMLRGRANISAHSEEPT